MISLTQENYTYQQEVYLDRSFGLGVFTRQDIKKGEVVWKSNPYFVRVISFDEAEHYGLMKYVYQCSKTGDLIICCDISRYENHSDDPNTESIELNGEVVTVAKRDINKGEEITGNYKDYDLLWQSKLPHLQ
jgi:SET domain-containing protein